MGVAPRRIMAALGGAQGLALWLLVEHWPDDPRIAAAFHALSTFLLVSALVWHLARTDERPGRLLALAAGTAGIFALVALWVGWQLPPDDVPYRGDASRVTSFVVASLAALYALVPFLQILQQRGAFHFPYPELYRHAWNNFFVAGLGALYTGALWVVLLLWASLFGLVGIDFFEHLFESEPFAFGVSGAALAYGLAVGHESHRVIATLRGLTQALFRGVEPLLAAASLAFLATLPFTGLEPLFAATSAASVVMSWVTAHVLFLNAVYLDGGARPPYAPPVRLLVEAGTAAMPILAAIGIYAVALRVEQHGLTPDRFLALLISSVLGLYALGYAAAVALRGEPWLPRLRAVNVGLAGLVIALALLLHTPLLDPIGWSLRSQLGRLARGAVSPDGFDFGFLRFERGQAGYAALLELANDEDAAPHVARALEVEHYWQWTTPRPGRPTPVFSALPAGAEIPERLRRGLSGSLGELADCSAAEPCVVVAADLDADGSDEYLLAQIRHPQINFVLAHDETNGYWRAIGRLLVPRDAYDSEAWPAALAEGKARIVASRYGDVEADGLRLRFAPLGAELP